ncbi:MAG TPA: dephospho-CoA kinase, partial [Longimicrobiales bacterium]|nr:dephospho-CoA kinase [Longimicrobiales bacterium]
IVNDIPLLFETGLDDQFDVIVLVHADAETRLQRIVQARGLSADEARSMIAAQMPSEQKRGRSHIVIVNQGTLEQLRERARQVWEELVAWRRSA